MESLREKDSIFTNTWALRHPSRGGEGVEMRETAGLTDGDPLPAVSLAPGCDRYRSICLAPDQEDVGQIH